MTNYPLINFDVECRFKIFIVNNWRAWDAIKHISTSKKNTSGLNTSRKGWNASHNDISTLMCRLDICKIRKSFLLNFLFYKYLIGTLGLGKVIKGYTILWASNVNCVLSKFYNKIFQRYLAFSLKSDVLHRPLSLSVHDYDVI